MAKSKDKRTPYRYWKVFTVVGFMLLMVTVFAVFVQVRLKEWLKDDPFTPLCHMPHLTLVYEADDANLYRVSANGELPQVIDYRGFSLPWSLSPDGETVLMHYVPEYSSKNLVSYLYLINVQSGEETIIELPYASRNVRFVQDSQAVLITSSQKDSTGRTVNQVLRVSIPSDGSYEVLLEEERTNNPPHISLPSIAPDGNAVVLGGWSTGTQTIVSNLDSDYLQLNPIPKQHGYPAWNFVWSPDSQTLYYPTFDDDSAVLYRFELGVDEHGQRLAELPTPDLQLLDISPQGTKIIYIPADDSVHDHMTILDAQIGDPLWHLTAHHQSQEVRYYPYGWLDENNFILGQNIHDEALKIYQANIETQSLEKIVEFPAKGARFARWLPEAKALIYGVEGMTDSTTHTLQVYVWTANGERKFISSHELESVLVPHNYLATPEGEAIIYWQENNHWLYMVHLEKQTQCRITKIAPISNWVTHSRVYVVADKAELK